MNEFNKAEIETMKNRKELMKGESGVFTYREVFTYRDLRNALDNFSEDDPELDQMVQILPQNPDTSKPTHLMPIYCIGSVRELCEDEDGIHEETRSVVDFKHHPEQLVLLSDYTPYDEEGNSYFTLEDEGMRGNETGKLYQYGE